MNPKNLQKFTKALSENYLHIVSFNVPYPANYGGVIDVFHKIRCLHKLGVKIHLHCFEYGRPQAKELNAYCASVNYYKRKKGLFHFLKSLPYIVATRTSETLIENLLKDKHPILLEGLHCCYLLKEKQLEGRFKIFRESNIEHEYYHHLFKGEKKPIKKYFYFFESIKLKRFENVLEKAQLMLTVSQSDTKYFANKFEHNKVFYLPSFHPNDDVTSFTGKGDYVLYHGNLEVNENLTAAFHILRNIVSHSDKTFVFAGLNPPPDLVNEVSKYPNAQIVCNPDDEQMHTLIEKAHIHLMLTFQATGLKLKLLNVLFKGRFCIANDNMLWGTDLDQLCYVSPDGNGIPAMIDFLFSQEFTSEEILNRKKILAKNYSNKVNAEKLAALIRFSC